MSEKILKGFVFEAMESEDAGRLSYDDMKVVGRIRLEDSDKPHDAVGDDLNDAPFNCNGSVFNGKIIDLERGDYVIIIKRRNKK